MSVGQFVSTASYKCGIIVSNMAASIQIERLTKTYHGDKTPALDALTLQVETGEVYGYLGANGAGKSTTIRLLLNFLLPTSGSAAIMGLNSVKQSVAVKKQVGYLAGDVALYQKATGKDLLDYLATLQSTKDANYRTKLEKRFEANLDKPIAELSKGNKQKIGIIQALMHQPDVLILDEPTTGLDPLMQAAFYDSIVEAKQRGAAVLMSSHNLAEAQRICDRVGIIKHGKLIREQRIDAFTALSKPVFRITLADPNEIEKLNKAQHLTFVSQADKNTLLMKPTGSVSAALSSLGHYNISGFSSQTADLEEEFMEFYGDAT